MSQVRQTTARQRQEAAEWLVRLDDESADETVAMAFADWLEGEPGRRMAFEAVESSWVDIDLAGAEALADVPQPVVVPLAARRRARPTAWIWSSTATTAVVALGAVAAVAAVAIGVTQMSPPAQIFETPVGKTQHVVLADGSKIALGGGSRVEVRFKGKSRTAELVRGEADFDIVHMPERPFTVAAGADTVRVLGTRFDVGRNVASLTVSVERGLVSVDRPDDGREPVLLAAGKQLHRHDGASDQIFAVDQAAASAWQTGRLVYRDRPLSEVAEDLSRYLPVPITTSPDVAGMPVTGVLNIADERNMVERLQTFLHVQATKTSTGIRLEHAKATD